MTPEQPDAGTADHTPKTRARQSRRHPLRWRAEAVLLGGAVGAIRALPEHTALAVGVGIGRGLARFDSHQRRLALANLQLVFPDWSSEEHHALLVQNFAELGRIAAEWARMPALSNDAVLDRTEVDGFEHLEAAIQQGRGALVVTAHYGFWEMGLPACGLRMPGSEVTAVERAQANPYLKDLLDRRRQFDGNPLLEQNAMSIRRALRRNAVVAVLADHYLSERRGGRLAPFLGLPAWSNPGPAALALSGDCAVVVAHVQRVDATRHRVALTPIALPDGDDRDAAIGELMTRINTAIGDFILREPKLWLWSHRRWRNSPAVSGEAYPSRRRRQSG